MKEKAQRVTIKQVESARNGGGASLKKEGESTTEKANTSQSLSPA